MAGGASKIMQAQATLAALPLIIQIGGIFILASMSSVIIFLCSISVDPNYLNVSQVQNRSYSRATTAAVIDNRKEYQQAQQDIQQEEVEKRDNILVDSKVAATPLGRTGLSKERFSEQYINNNELLLKYATEYAGFTVKFGNNTFTFDGLSYLAQANTESKGWLRDMDITISSAIPSKALPPPEDDFEKWMLSNSIRSVLNYVFSTANPLKEPRKIWGNDVKTQGPLTQWVTTDSNPWLNKEADSELTYMSASLKTAMNDEVYFTKIQTTCTGSGYMSLTQYCDRFSLEGSALAYKASILYWTPNITNITGDVSFYEALCYLRFLHWQPGLLTSSYSVNSSLPYANDDANSMKLQYFLDYAKALGSSEVITYIRERVREDLSNKNYDIYVGNSNDPSNAEFYDNIKTLVGTEIYSKLTTNQARREFPLYLYEYIFLEELYGGY